MITKCIRSVNLLAILFFTCFASSASASIMVNLDSITPFGGNYDWDYTAWVSPTDGLAAQTYFTIYDLPGNLITVEVVGDWAASSQNTGDTPAGLTPTDDPTLINVTFALGGSANYPGSSVSPISGFRIRLDTDVAEFGDYSWQDWDQYPLGNVAQLQSGLGTIGDGRNATIPEPSTLVLLGTGLLGVAGIARRRKS